MYGCIGVILFSDPQQYSGGDPTDTYPANWWLPPTGVQRGTIKFSRKFRGDPLTPSYPSIGMKVIFCIGQFQSLNLIEFQFYNNGNLHGQRRS